MLLKEEIHELLLSFAEAGATVVRLKGGDPLVSFFILLLLLLFSYMAPFLMCFATFV